jgi:broad specificity phosphatase PhoE
MTRLYLVRHGHFAGIDEIHRGTAPEAPLDDLGRSQIESLAERFKNETIKIVLTSEMVRAQESGQIIADLLHLPVESTPILNELGFFISPKEIMTFERDEDKYQQSLGDLNKSSNRAIEFIGKISREHSGETVAVVCHGNIIRAIIGEALKADVNSIIRLQIDLASLSVLEYDGGDLFRLIRMNDTCHLEK